MHRHVQSSRNQRHTDSPSPHRPPPSRFLQQQQASRVFRSATYTTYLHTYVCLIWSRCQRGRYTLSIRILNEGFLRGRNGLTIQGGQQPQTMLHRQTEREIDPSRPVQRHQCVTQDAHQASPARVSRTTDIIIHLSTAAGRPARQDPSWARRTVAASGVVGRGHWTHRRPLRDRLQEKSSPPSPCIRTMT